MATEKEILHTLKERPEQGFRLLMATYKEPIYWHIRRLVVSHDDAQDATQETFVRVFRSLPQFEGKGSLGAWIYRIATNEALRLRMQRQEEVELAFCNLSHEDQEFLYTLYADEAMMEEMDIETEEILTIL